MSGLEIPAGFVRIVFGLYGLVIGSFLNVVIHRLPRGASIFLPRSACPACGHRIRWWENVPVLSWLLLRGRCSACASRIHWRYPAVELLTAGLLLLALERFGLGVELVAACLLIVLVIPLVFIDLEHMLLPDALTLTGAFAGLALSFVRERVPDGEGFAADPAAGALLGALVGLFLIEGLNLAYKLVRRQDGFGAGDTKMMMMLGAFLGWQDVLLVLMVATLTGALVAIPALALARARSRRNGAEPEPAPASAAEGADSGAAPPADEARDLPRDSPSSEGRSALLDVVPRDAAEWLGLCTVVVLVASFLVPGMEPRRSLAGLLAGVAALVALRRLVPRARRLAACLPLVGAAAGLPPHGAGLLASLGVSALVLWRDRREPADEPAADADVLAGADAPTLLQAAIPFGVFLGIAAILVLFAGGWIVDTYFALAWSPAEP